MLGGGIGQLAAQDALGDVERELGGGVADFGQGGVFLGLDGFAGLRNHPAAFFCGLVFGRFDELGGHLLGLGQGAVALVAGFGHQLFVAGFELLHLDFGLVGHAQGAFDAVLALAQAGHNRLPGKLGEDEEQQQEQDRLPEQQAELGGD